MANIKLSQSVFLENSPYLLLLNFNICLTDFLGCFSFARSSCHFGHSLSAAKIGRVGGVATSAIKLTMIIMLSKHSMFFIYNFQDFIFCLKIACDFFNYDDNCLPNILIFCKKIYLNAKTTMTSLPFPFSFLLSFPLLLNSPFRFFFPLLPPPCILSLVSHLPSPLSFPMPTE